MKTKNLYGKNSYLPVLLGASLALTACGGGGGGGGDSESSSGLETVTFSGQARIMDGSTVAKSEWIDLPKRMLATLITPGHAADFVDIAGMVNAPEGTVIQLLDIDEVNGELITTELGRSTVNNGQFSFDVPLEVDDTGIPTADIVIQVGTGSDSFRVPASSPVSTTDIVATPVGAAVTTGMTNAIQSGTATFADFESVELANVVREVNKHLSANGIVLTSSTNKLAAQEIDDNAPVQELIELVKGESGISLSGAWNLATHGIEMEGDGLPEAQWSANSQTGTVNVVDNKRLDFSGQSIEEASIRGYWDFRDPSNNDLSADNVTDQSVETDIVTETLPEGEGFGITIGTDGRILAGNLVGAASSNGDVLALAGTDQNLFTSFIVSGTQWQPGDFSKEYNFVAFQGVVRGYLFEQDPGTAVGDVGYVSTMSAEAGLVCATGSCDVTIDRLGASSNKVFVDWDPTVMMTAGDSSFTTSFTQLGVALGDDGSLLQDDTSGNFSTRGFVAPNGDFLLLQARQVSDDTAGSPYRWILIGTPKGASCDSTSMSGTYNVLSREMTFGGQSGAGLVSGVMEAHVKMSKFTADGAGNLSIGASNKTVAEIRIDSGIPSDNIEARSESQTAVSYSVDSDCKVTVAGTGSDRFAGAVSPDGQIVVFASFDTDNITDPTTSANSLMIGFKEPAP